MGIGASLGEEAVLADSERVGEVAAAVGRVRKATFPKHPTSESDGEHGGRRSDDSRDQQ